MHITVVTSSKSKFIGDGLTYKTTNESLQAGSYVQVPLKDKFIDGIVTAVKQSPSTKFEAREIDKELLESPALFPAQLQTMQWIKQYYHCGLRDSLNLFLPPGPWARTMKELACQPKLSERRLVEKERSTPSPITLELPPLNEEQQQAYKAIQNDKRPSLLFGITGSGKTHVYAALIADALKENKQALLLLPEILLTEHTVQFFEEYIGKEHIAILHSRLTESVRRKQWLRIHSGEARVVIGSRSALFTPLEHIGLIIIDEEHEWTYKNEQTPRYHARETAEMLSHYSGAKLVFGTATPSLDTWHRAEEGRYHKTELVARFAENTLPSVKVVDLTTVQFGNSYPFSPVLLDAIKDRLEKKEQCVLFLNRRGVATAMLCMECKKRLVCADSGLPYTVHKTLKGQPFLLDHLTGVVEPVPSVCPHCNSPKLQSVGAGTHKIEDLLATHVPSARVIRADKDTLSTPDAIRTLLDKMNSGEADILLGTQSVVKGLDISGVTLAAVLVADIGLSIPHFRAGERVFQLLTQLTGRSGRAKPGEVIIQTFRPDASEIVHAAAHDTVAYLNQEKEMRSTLRYPPFTDMARLICRGEDAKQQAITLEAALKQKKQELTIDAHISRAPALSGTPRSWHIFIRSNKIPALLHAVDTTTIIVDRDPM